jgi:hypothetical protein
MYVAYGRGLLLQAITFDASRMCLAVLLSVIRVLFAPLARAFPASLTVVRIACKFPLAVVGTTLSLAAGIAADGLRGLAYRQREELVAMRATPFDHSGVVAFPAEAEI